MRDAAITLICSLLLSSVHAQLSLSLLQQVINAPVQAVESVLNGTDLDRRQVATVATNRWNCYTASVGIGSPATTYTLMLDNGSSNTWIRNYQRTGVSKSQRRTATVNYAVGSMSGTQYYDTLSVAGATITNQSVTRATKSSNFDDVDGLLAFGPVGLTEDTVEGVSQVPTFVDNLFTQGLIPSRMVGVAFEPVTSVTDTDGVSNGLLTLGGIDSAHFTGDMHWMSMTTRSKANQFFGVDATSIRLENQTSSMPLTSNTRAGILDTGTTLIKLPSDAFATYVAQLAGASVNDAGFLTIPNSAVPSMQNLTFTMGDRDFILTPSAQLFPPEVASQFGQSSNGQAISVLADSGTVNSGLDFVLGMQFLERYYSAYDVDQNRIGLAETQYTWQKTSQLASFRRAKRAHSTRADSWVHGKRRLHALQKRRSR